MSPDPERCSALVVELGRHARLLHVFKARLAGRAPTGIDGAAFGLLMHLIKGGPLRQGELADASMLDPSTVSRYVAQLVKTGLVERRTDPSDGRAVRLAATDAGDDLGCQAVERRERLLAQLVDDWSDEDLCTFVQLMRRLNDGMEARRDASGPPGTSPDGRLASATD